MQENPKVYIVMRNNITVLIGTVDSFFLDLSATNFVFQMGGSYDIIDVQLILKGDKKRLHSRGNIRLLLVLINIVI